MMENSKELLTPSERETECNEALQTIHDILQEAATRDAAQEPSQRQIVDSLCLATELIDKELAAIKK